MLPISTSSPVEQKKVQLEEKRKPCPSFVETTFSLESLSNDDESVVSENEIIETYSSRWLPLFHTLLSLILVSYGVAICWIQKPGFKVALLAVLLSLVLLFSKYLSFPYASCIYSKMGSFYQRVIRAWHRSPAAQYPKLLYRCLSVIIPLLLVIVWILLKGDSESGTRFQRLMSLSGLLIFVSLLGLFSKDITKIHWNRTLLAIYLQFALGALIFGTKVGSDVFGWMAKRAEDILHSSEAGAIFLFKPYSETFLEKSFALTVFPALIFFASIIQVLYYLGIMQRTVHTLAKVVVRWFHVSGAESAVAIASPFVGQGESALLIKPFIKNMTPSELHSIMVSGFATISGGILMALIAQGIDGKALITSCIMSIPCSLALSKLRVPETHLPETLGHKNSSSLNSSASTSTEETNLVHAAGKGAIQGMHLSLTMGAILLAFISIIKLADNLLGFFSGLLGWRLTFEIMTQYLFLPVALLLGVPFKESFKVAQLLGTKMFVNEFIAYSQLKSLLLRNALSERAELLATFALCGFANVGSIGVQVGILGAMAPERQGTIASLAVSAMLTGTICTLMSACIAGIII